MLARILLAMILALAAAGGDALAGDVSLNAVVEAYARATQESLSRMDQGLARAAQELSKKGVRDVGQVRGVLRDLLASCPQAIDVCFIDGAGRILYLEPEQYRHHEGADISAQDQVKLLWQTRRPVMSQVFRTVEGVDAVDLEHPVWAGNGALLGSVSVLFRPDAVLAEVWDKTETKRELEPWAMDGQGRILFDQDKQEIDNHLFSGEMYRSYPQLLAIGRRILDEPAGQGAYSFPPRGGERPLTKDCAWASVELHGAWWRVVVADVRR